MYPTKIAQYPEGIDAQPSFDAAAPAAPDVAEHAKRSRREQRRRHRATYRFGRFRSTGGQPPGAWRGSANIGEATGRGAATRF